jgi:mannose-1-phosphate guanylyltransferase
VTEFVEKPDAETAQAYLAEGGYSWNAGMFVAPVQLLLKHLETNEPLLYAGLMEIAAAWDTSKRREVVRRVWPGLPKTAIDYAVAEPAAAAGDVAMIPGDFSWDDVGDFAAIGRLNAASETNNLTVLGEGARVYAENATGMVVSDTKRVIALIGINDVVVVDTPDALLITTKEHAQQVKKAVESLRASGDTDVL